MKQKMRIFGCILLAAVLLTVGVLPCSAEGVDAILQFLSEGGTLPNRFDVNNDGIVSIMDVTAMLTYLKNGCTHEEVTVPGRAATCTEPGLTDSTYCPKCWAVVRAAESIEPLGHDYGENGICKRCGAEREIVIDTPTIQVSSETAKAGATAITVTVSVMQNPGILGATFSLHYDTSVLTLKSAANGSALPLNFQKPGRFKDGCNFVWYGETIATDDIADGSLLTLTFDVAAGAAEGFSPITISYIEGDVFTNGYQPLSFTLLGGGITVTK